MGDVHNREPVKQFAASEFGKRVGWVRVKEFEEHPFVAIDVVTAEVTSEDGAEYGFGYWKNEETQEKASSDYPYTRGFGRVAAFSAFISRDNDRREESNLRYSAEGMKYPYHTPEAHELLSRGTGDNRDIEEDEKIWTAEPSELLATLRETLVKIDFESAYKIMYYLINGAVAQDYPMTSHLSNVRPQTLMIPDPSMGEETTEQIAHLEALASAYREGLINDTNMRNRISGFIDDIPREGIPDRFVQSRERAFELEEQVSEAASKLVFQRLAYAPTGHGRGARTWPYMDASVSDTDKAYGLELRDLREKKTGRAILELDREIRELEGRSELANQALQRLRLLSELEKA